MSVPTPTDLSAARVRYCTYCGSDQLQSQNLPRTFLDKAFALHHYRCEQCRNRQRKFRLSWGMTAAWSTVVLLLAAGAWFWIHPFTIRANEESSQTTVDSLARARTAAGGLSAFGQLMINRPRATMDNATILKLWRAEVGRDVILQMIRTSNSDYDVSANAIIELKQDGMDQAIILAMIDASYRSR